MELIVSARVMQVYWASMTFLLGHCYEALREPSDPYVSLWFPIGFPWVWKGSPCSFTKFSHWLTQFSHWFTKFFQRCTQFPSG